MTSDANLFDGLNLDRNRADLGETLSPAPETPTASPKSPEEPKPFSFSEGLDHAMLHETLTGYGAKLAAEPEFTPDPDLELTVGYFEENFADIPRQYHSYLYEGESIAEINHKAATLRLRLEDEARFSEMDIGSQIGTLVAATALDAPALLATLVVSAGAGAISGGAGAVPGLTAVGTRLGLTGSRIAKVVGIGTGVATEAMIHEAILASADPLKNEKTVMLAGLMGFGFGTVGGEIGHRIVTSASNKAAAKDAKNLGDHLIRKAIQEINGVPSSPKSFLTSSTSEITPLDTLYATTVSDTKGLRSVAIDQTSRLKRTPDPELQKLGDILGEDGIFGGGSTMAIDFDTTTRPILADGLKGFNEGYNQWAKDSGVNFVGRVGHKNRLEFNSKVARVVRGIDEASTPGEAAAASASQKFFKDMLDVAKTSGVKGFEDIPDSINYLTRTYSQSNFRRITAQLGSEAPLVIQRTLAGAIKAGLNDFDDEVADVIAKGIYKRAMSTKLPSDDKFTTVLTNNFKDELQGILEDAELDAKKIEKILTKLTQKEVSELKETKSRINLDEAFTDLDSGISISDLLEDNVEQIMSRYARSVGGASSAAKFGFETPQSLLNHINKVSDKAFQEGRMSENAARRARQNATNLANQILGRPNEEFNAFAQGAQLLMDYEFIRTSGGFALASLPEMMITTAENGLAATLKHTPIASKFIRDIRNNVKPNQELLSVLESWGVGRDMDMMNAFVRIAEDDALNASFSKGIQTLNAGKRVAAMASGLPQLTRFSQIIAGKSSIQKFTDMAHSGKPVKLKQWLKQLGFDDEQKLEDVFIGLRKHSITQPGLVKGRKVVGLDYDKWLSEDPVAATRFMYAVARRVNHQIQRNLPGETPEFMSKTWGKLAMQFKTFGIAAYGKKTLNAVARRDVESAVAIGYTTTAAAMIYAARMYVMAQTRDDPKGFLRERLSQKNIVKAAIQRSGFASVLPTMIDNGLSLFQQDRVFNDYARTSGLNVGGIESIPAAQTGLNLAKTAGAGFNAAVKGDNIEEKDVRAAVDLLPLRRLPGINYALETIINAFPQRGREK